MGVYSNQVLPRLLNVACAAKSSLPLRRRVCENLRGEVVEIGFGSGLNIPFYPPTVTGVSAIEPSDVAWNLAGERLAATTTPVRRSGLDGQVLPLPDDSHAAVLSTWTLCTIPDVAAALSEIRRVLEPGRALHFLEHGLAPDDGVQRWQRRFEPLQKRFVGGCHLTRPIVEILQGAGFQITELDVFYEEGSPKVLGADSLGIAVPL